MNDAAARTGGEDIAGRARQLVDSITRAHDEHSSVEPDPVDDDLTTALGQLDETAFSPAALAAADVLLEQSGQMSVQARQRMVEGAERGLRWRKNMTGSLWRALRTQRQRQGLDHAHVATKLSMSAAALRHLENGSTPVQEVDPEVIVTWIRTVQLDPELALPALHRSLLPQRSEGVYAGEPSTDGLSDSAQSYFDAVRQLLR